MGKPVRAIGDGLCENPLKSRVLEGEDRRRGAPQAPKNIIGSSFFPRSKPFPALWRFTALSDDPEPEQVGQAPGKQLIDVRCLAPPVLCRLRRLRDRQYAASSDTPADLPKQKNLPSV